MATPTEESPDIQSETVEIILSPAQWWGDNEYLVSRPAVAPVLAPGTMVQVEFYNSAGDEAQTPGPRFVDYGASDGWVWE